MTSRSGIARRCNGREAVASVGEEPAALKHVVNDDWLEYVELELAARAGEAHPASLPITCTHTIVIASDCVGLTLPGMMLLPGSFSGR